MVSMDVLVAECTGHQVAAGMPKLKMVPVFNEKSGVMTGLGLARTWTCALRGGLRLVEVAETSL